MASGFLSITADDGYVCAATELPQILKAHAVSGTFYLHCDRCPTSTKATHRLAASTVFDDLISAKQELGAHSFHHLSWPTLSKEEQLSELRALFVFYGRLGIVPKSFAYPYGHWDQATEELIGSFFETALIAEASVPFDKKRPHLIPRFGIEAGWNVQELLLRFEHMAASWEIKWLVVMIHDLSREDLSRLGDLISEVWKRGWIVGSVSQCWEAIRGCRE